MAISQILAGAKTPSKILWVSPGGSDANSGAEGAPLKTIQAAIDKAGPGTAVMVKAGTYAESVKLTGKHGTPDKPIQLISADGPHAAKIVGGPKAAAITGYKVSNIVIKDFHIVADTAAGDIGGIKIWGEFNRPAKNILIEGNLVTGRGQDGLKVFMGATDIAIVGNTIDGDWRQEIIDFNAVENAVIAYNTLRGKAGYTGITMKLGTRDVHVVGNDIDIKAGTGILVGGHGNSHLSGSYRFDMKQWGQTMAERILVEGNAIDAAETSLSFVGSRDSVVKGNYLADPVGSVGYSPGAGHHYPSYNHKLVDNIVASAGFFKPEPGQADGVFVSGNEVGTARPPAGADHAEGFLDRPDPAPAPRDKRAEFGADGFSFVAIDPALVVDAPAGPGVVLLRIDGCAAALGDQAMLVLGSAGATGTACTLHPVDGAVVLAATDLGS